MAWIESHQGLLRHPKLTNAVELLQCNRYQLIGHLQALWWWGLDVADPDGKLPPTCSPAVIADAAGWPTADAERFVNALVDCGGRAKGFIERKRNNYFLHDWSEYAGHFNDLREKRSAAGRAGGLKSGENRRESGGSKTKQTRSKPDFASKQNEANGQANEAPTDRNRPTLTDLNRPTVTDRPTDPAAAAKVAWEDRVGQLSQADEAELLDLSRQVPDAWFLDAIEETVTKSDSAPWPFCRAILKRCIETQQPPRKKRQPRAVEGTARAGLLNKLENAGRQA